MGSSKEHVRHRTVFVKGVKTRLKQPVKHKSKCEGSETEKPETDRVVVIEAVELLTPTRTTQGMPLIYRCLDRLRRRRLARKYAYRRISALINNAKIHTPISVGTTKRVSIPQ